MIYATIDCRLGFVTSTQQTQEIVVGFRDRSTQPTVLITWDQDLC